MDVLAAVLACSLYADDSLVRAIIQSTSLSDPYSVVDPAADESLDESPPPPPRTLDDAMARLREIAGRGGTPLVGLMQVPPDWAVLFGREPRDLFDPCINISIGTARLSEFDGACKAEPKIKPTPWKRKRPPKARPSAAENRPCVVRKYADAIGMNDFAIVTSLELDHQRLLPLVAKASEAPIFAAGDSSRTWGADRLLFQPARALESAPPERAAANEPVANDRGVKP